MLRANALGDFVVCLPALDSLRQAYPQAQIVLIGTTSHAELLDGRPGPVDRVVVVPRGAVGDESADGAAVDDFFRRMQAEQFDLAIQMQGGGRESNPFMKRLGARVTAGMRAENAPSLDRWIRWVYWQHEVLRFLEVASLVGATPGGIQPRLNATPDDIGASRQVLQDDGRPLAVLHPGATDPRRRWPARRFAAVGNALAAEGARVVVVGAENERILADEVAGSMTPAVENLAGRTSLSSLVGLLARAAVCVANDSGPRHLAEAVGTATIGIYWCGNVINASPLTRAFHRPLISWRLDCPECGISCVSVPYRCPHNPSFVCDVPVEAVVHEALDLLHMVLERSAWDMGGSEPCVGAADGRD